MLTAHFAPARRLLAAAAARFSGDPTSFLALDPQQSIGRHRFFGEVHQCRMR
jgi:hypothetical protein